MLCVNGCITRVADPDHLKASYDGHAWFALREQVSEEGGSTFYRGAVACAFQGADTARDIFLPLFKPEAEAAAAFAAHQWLSYAYLREGRYRHALAEINAMAVLEPADESLASARQLLETLSLAPEQTMVRKPAGSVAFKTQMNAMFPTVRVNGHPARYFMDCGANISMISLGEAKRVGMTIRTVGEGATKVVDATGAKVGFQIAVADEISIGECTIRNIAFLVFPDGAQPWRDLPEGERGGLGISVWLALGTLRVHREGNLEMAFPTSPTRREPNLCFDGATPLVLAEFQGRRLPLLLDSGAGKTDFWPAFARDFPELMRRGNAGSRTISGVGSTETFETIELPEIAIELGGVKVVRRPAHVLLKETAGEAKYCYARLG